MKKTVFENALTAARGAYDASPALQRFAPWPDDLRYQEKEAQIIPAVRQIKRWSNPIPSIPPRKTYRHMAIGSAPIPRRRSALAFCKTTGI